MTRSVGETSTWRYISLRSSSGRLRKLKEDMPSEFGCRLKNRGLGWILQTLLLIFPSRFAIFRSALNSSRLSKRCGGCCLPQKKRRQLPGGLYSKGSSGNSIWKRKSRKRREKIVLRFDHWKRLSKLCPGAPLFGFSGTFAAVFGGLARRRFNYF